MTGSSGCGAVRAGKRRAWAWELLFRLDISINKYRMRYVGLGRDNLRSHFVFRPRHAPEWLRARFLPVVFLANEEELTGKTFTTSLNTTNPNTYVKFIFLRTSPLTSRHGAAFRTFFFQDPLEAILVIFGRWASIFFCLKVLGKIREMTPLLCACAVVITLETQKCRKMAPRSVELNFFINCGRQKRFRRMKEEGQINKKLLQML